MKRIFPFLSALILLFACNKNNADVAILKINYTGDETSFDFNSNDTSYSLRLNQGKYADTIKNVNHYYYLVAGEYELDLFLEAGDDISINIDGSKGLEGVVFTGKGADKQTYLLDKQLKMIAYGKKINDWYNKDGETFKKNIQSVITELKGLLKTANLSNDFTDTEMQSIHFTHYSILASYPSYHEYLTGEKAESLEKFIPKEISNFDFNNETFYKQYRDYQDIVLNHSMGKFYTNIKEIYPTIGKKEISFLNAIKIEKLKNEILEQCGYFMSSSNEKLGEFYDALIAHSSNNDFKRSLTEKYNILKNLTPGKKSPSFAFPQTNGNILKLEDLRGKYVFIDVWATWCEPCKKEIPALKALEEKMKGKNIAFVSISVDSPQDKNTWIKFVEDKNLGGYQLFADNAFNSFFIKQYAIDAVPRFILIDKEGKIISGDAPKPSSDKIEEFFNQHIK
jgi:thiol-disulfide isomerase/thioredoxin